VDLDSDGPPTPGSRLLGLAQYQGRVLLTPMVASPGQSQSVFTDDCCSSSIELVSGETLNAVAADHLSEGLQEADSMASTAIN